MDFTPFFPLFAAGAVFFIVLFAYNMKKPKTQ
jgi:hypothetical protein